MVTARHSDVIGQVSSQRLYSDPSRPVSDTEVVKALEASTNGQHHSSCIHVFHIYLQFSCYYGVITICGLLVIHVAFFGLF